VLRSFTDYLRRSSCSVLGVCISKVLC
jgi:hypothetical protein